MTSVEETLALLRHADETLLHARINHREGLHRTAVSLAYYAAFYAARAVCAVNLEGPKTHRRVITRFNFLAVKQSDSRPSCLNSSRSWRHNGWKPTTTTPPWTTGPSRTHRESCDRPGGSWTRYTIGSIVTTARNSKGVPDRPR